MYVIAPHRSKHFMFPTLSTKLLNISKLVHGILDMVCSTVHVECDIFASITFANGAYGQEQFYPLILLSKITRSLLVVYAYAGFDISHLEKNGIVILTYLYHNNYALVN